MRSTLILLLFFFVAIVSVAAQENDRENAGGHSVPDINVRATLLVKPDLPGDVLISRDGTTLAVKTQVDEEGNVISAKCSMTCPRDAAGSAEAAAMASKFAPLVIQGRAVKYDGILLYAIAVARVNWFRFGGALYSVYIFDNLSVGPVAAQLTTDYSDEKEKLRSLDSQEDLNFRWKTIEDVKNSLERKLPAKDAWTLRVGMAIRKVTAPFQCDKRFDRAELQRALTDLATLADSAPNDVGKEYVDKLRAVAAYKIDPAMRHQDLVEAIFKSTATLDPDSRVRRRPLQPELSQPGP